MENMEDMITNSEPPNNVYYVKDEPSEEGENFITKDVEDSGSIFEPAVSILLPDTKDGSYSDVEIECDVDVSEDSQWTLKDDLNLERNFSKGEGNDAISEFMQKESIFWNEDHVNIAEETAYPTHFLEKPFACTTCDKKFTLRKNMRKHQRLHAQRKTFSCKICAKKFTDRCSLDDHSHVHSKKKTSSCGWCAKQFGSEIDLMKHVTCHFNEIAEKSSRGNNRLERNSEDASFPEIKPYTCDACDKAYSLKKHLVRHRQTHLSEKPFPCNACEKKFYRRDHLKIHLRSHAGNEPLACATCLQDFTHQCDYVRHLPCDIGKPRYVNRDFSNAAIRETYPCDKCGRSYSQKKYLARHYRLHTGEKPYACQFCDKTYVRSDTLANHLRCHSTSEMFACDWCDKVFILKNDFLKHLPSHYAEIAAYRAHNDNEDGNFEETDVIQNEGVVNLEEKFEENV